MMISLGSRYGGQGSKRLDARRARRVTETGPILLKPAEHGTWDKNRYPQIGQNAIARRFNVRDREPLDWPRRQTPESDVRGA
jgi:hypothetical protein